MSDATPAPVAGLWGKLPAHGDFVRRGWDDATVGALDAWLSPALAARRAVDGEADFATRMHGAPLWHGLLPAGIVGPAAMRIVLTPSVDRVGRLFPLILGVAGPVDWAAGALAAGLDAVAYDAVSGAVDADTAIAAIGRLIVPGGDATGPGGWWPDLFDPAAPATLPPGPLDAGLLDRLLLAERGDTAEVPGRAPIANDG